MSCVAYASDFRTLYALRAYGSGRTQLLNALANTPAAPGCASINGAETPTTTKKLKGGYTSSTPLLVVGLTMLDESQLEGLEKMLSLHVKKSQAHTTADSTKSDGANTDAGTGGAFLEEVASGDDTWLRKRLIESMASLMVGGNLA